MGSQTSSKLNFVHSEFRRKIESGEWKVGSHIPTASDLAKMFNCGIGTISKAFALLAHAGLVEQRTRAGTRVISRTGLGEAPRNSLAAFAFIFPSDQHEGIRRIVAGFQEAAHAKSRRVLMLTTGIDYRKEAEFMGRLSEFDVRGAVIYPLLQTANDQMHFSQMLMNSKYPVVLAEVNIAGLGWPAVVVDGFHAGYTMTRHLIEKGAKKIGFLSNYFWVPSMRDRYMGYRWALRDAGLQEIPECVVQEQVMQPDFMDALKEPEQLGSRFLEQCGKPDAVVCADDFLAQGLILAAKKKGLNVPSDLRVVGINDYGFDPEKCPPLTTYRVPCETIGKMTFDILDALLQQKPLESKEVLVEGELVVRQSG